MRKPPPLFALAEPQPLFVRNVLPLRSPARSRRRKPVVVPLVAPLLPERSWGHLIRQLTGNPAPPKRAR